MINWPKSIYWRNEYPELQGVSDIVISQVCSANNPKDHAILFVNSMTEACCESLIAFKGCLIIANRADADACQKLLARHALLFSDDPRYEFARVLRPLWDNKSMRGTLAFDQERSIYCGSNVNIHPEAIIEPGVTIAEDCAIGAGVYIMTGARLGPNVHIGENTVIRENAVIGGWGFGFARTDGTPTIRIPHIGGVRIGCNVEIGALTTVSSGTIDPTIIEDGVLIDDNAHVAHNCIVMRNSIITACAEISGSVKIGHDSWLGPNCSIIDRIDVGNHAMIGIGAVVVKPTIANATMFGNPARKISQQ